MKTPYINPRISDKILITKTGKTFEQWFDLLDAIGALHMTHPEIARYLCNTYGNSHAWHFQMITNAYEQVRKGRKKHEKKDGYEISITKTISAPLSVVYGFCHDEKSRKKWLKEPLELTTIRPNKSLRARWEHIAPSSLSIDVVKKGVNKTQVVVQHSKLPSLKQAESFKEMWKLKLEAFKNLLE